MVGIFNLEICFEHAVWRALTDNEIPFRVILNERHETVHILVEDTYITRVALLLKNLRMTL